MTEAKGKPGDGGHPLRHLAIIMDGNNRWARRDGLSGIAGHRAGAERVRDALEACGQHEIEILTLFAFSSENWARPRSEVRKLLSLLANYLRRETGELCARNIRLRVIGSRARFSDRLRRLIEKAEKKTAAGAKTLVLAIDYGGRWDIANAARVLAARVQTGELRPEDIDEAAMASEMALSDLPAPDLCIRTAGEQRLSNFLLWQLAYTELYFPDCYWPDFDRAQFDQAVASYYRRQRRFGLTARQLDDDDDQEKARA